MEPNCAVFLTGYVVCEKKDPVENSNQTLSFMVSGYSFHMKDYFDVEMYNCMFTGS